jgi:hypothetical protein
VLGADCSFLTRHFLKVRPELLSLELRAHPLTGPASVAARTPAANEEEAVHPLPSDGLSTAAGRRTHDSLALLSPFPLGQGEPTAWHHTCLMESTQLPFSSAHHGTFMAVLCKNCTLTL